MNVGSASDPIDLTRDEYDISPIKVFDSTRMPSNRSLEPTDVPSTSIPSLTIDGPVVVQPVRTQTIHDPLQLAYIPPSHMYTKSDDPSGHRDPSYNLALDQKLILPQQRKVCNTQQPQDRVNPYPQYTSFPQYPLDHEVRTCQHYDKHELHPCPQCSNFPQYPGNHFSHEYLEKNDNPSEDGVDHEYLPEPRYYTPDPSQYFPPNHDVRQVMPTSQTHSIPSHQSISLFDRYATPSPPTTPNCPVSILSYGIPIPASQMILDRPISTSVTPFPISPSPIYNPSLQTRSPMFPSPTIFDSSYRTSCQAWSEVDKGDDELSQTDQREVFPWNYSMVNRFCNKNGESILEAEMARSHVNGEPASAQSDINSTVSSVIDMRMPQSVFGETTIDPTHNPEGSVERQHGLNEVYSSVRYPCEVRISGGVTRRKLEQAKPALHHPYARRGTDKDVRSSRKTITRDIGDPTMHLTQKENCQDSFAPLSQNKSTPQVIHQNRPMTSITTSQTQCSPFQQATDNLLEPLEEPPSGSTPKSPPTSGPSKNIGDAIMTMSCDTSKEVTTELPANDHPTIVLSHVATPSTNLTRNAASLSDPIDPPTLYPELENLFNSLPFEMRPTPRMSTIFSSFRRHPKAHTKNLNSPLFYVNPHSLIPKLTEEGFFSIVSHHWNQLKEWQSTHVQYTFHPKTSVQGQICDTRPAISKRRDQRSNWINQVYLAYVVRQTMEVVDIVGEKKISQEGLKKCTYVEKEKYGLGHLFTPEEGMKSLDDALRSWTAATNRPDVNEDEANQLSAHDGYETVDPMDLHPESVYVDEYRPQELITRSFSRRHLHPADSSHVELPLYKFDPKALPVSQISQISVLKNQALLDSDISAFIVREGCLESHRGAWYRYLASLHGLTNEWFKDHAVGPKKDGTTKTNIRYYALLDIGSLYQVCFYTAIQQACNSLDTKNAILTNPKEHFFNHDGSAYRWGIEGLDEDSARRALEAAWPDDSKWSKGLWNRPVSGQLSGHDTDTSRILDTE
ncbi:hypothetical protein M231_06831 [Tremella mesenterica]|uniref:Uncharacterized protein n=1 Tax=Tremella mesenterica TaxID=5217 RepID=A0A4Q1BG04_TREME|nr:hypothetical protein M231_06831 [Tremella mesenterica]